MYRTGVTLEGEIIWKIGEYFVFWSFQRNVRTYIRHHSNLFPLCLILL